MTDFVFLYRGGNRPSSPEEGQKEMQKWVTWMQALGAKGHLKDQGHPLEQTGRVVKGKPGALSDGPFAEVKDVVGGYTLISAKDLAEAAELSKGCPIFANGGFIEVRPVMAM